MQSIEDRIKPLIGEQVGISPSSVSDDDTIYTLGGDSLDRVELVMMIEDDFMFEIPDEEADKLQTVKQIVDYVEANAK